MAAMAEILKHYLCISARINLFCSCSLGYWPGSYAQMSEWCYVLKYIVTPLGTIA